VLDVEAGKIPYDKRWTQKELPNYFCKTAESEKMKQIAPTYQDFYLTGRFFGARRKKSYLNSELFNMDDDNVFSVED
jgi:hypothetical protein